MTRMTNGMADEIYERQIRSLPLTERLYLAGRIVSEAAAGAEELPRKSRSLLELQGLGAELLEGVDAQEYVNKLRQEWDHRP